MSRARTPSGYGLGWRPDLPDGRDLRYRATMLSYVAPPPSVRLDESPHMPGVYDQGQLGSCTANAIAAAVEYDLKAQGLADAMPSRLFVYYNEREIEGDVGSDGGAMIRDGVKSVHKLGVCAESEWPYDLGQFAVKPPAKCYADAKSTRLSSYARVDQDVHAWKAALAAQHPIVFGFTVYESFESIPSSGLMPMPTPGESVLGGHAVLAVGYDVVDGKPHWRVRNSWGPGWGDGGYFWMPQEYAMTRDLASDFWMLRTVT